MKTLIFCFAFLLLSCTKTTEEKTAAVLSTMHKSEIFLLTLNPVSSAAPDSLDLIISSQDVGFYASLVESAMLRRDSLHWSFDSLAAARARRSYLAELIDQPRAPGFTICRYITRPAGDTLLTIFSPELKPVWTK